MNAKEDKMTREQQKSGVFGLGITGISIYESLVTKTFTICYDDNAINRENFITKFGDKDLLPITDNKWTTLDQIIVSPGVPHTHPIFKLAKDNNVKITSDIELFAEQNTNSEFIFITGTNGKSTSTALTGHILKKAKLDYHIGGNIGTPVMALPTERKGYVLELSSFQIELLNKIDPKIAVITNITPDHLDRHESIEEYIGIKEKILTPDSLKIIGINSDISRNIYDKFKKIYGSKIIAVSNNIALSPLPALNLTNDLNDNLALTEPPVAEHKNDPQNSLVHLKMEIGIKNGIFCNDVYLEDNYFDQQKYELPFLPHLHGAHNKENIAISYAICRALGVPGKFIIEALQSFTGLRHRMEYIGSYNAPRHFGTPRVSGTPEAIAINFYNDSKATNISSALSSLSAFKNIIWFAGGRFKENSFNELTPALRNIRKAYLFGESKNLFAKFLDGKVAYKVCHDLEGAFANAMEEFDGNQFSTHDDTSTLTFLLAPACSSYDQFKNFEERGKLFAKLVRNINPQVETKD